MQEVTCLLAYGLLLCKSNLTSCGLLAAIVVVVSSLLPTLLQLIACSLYLGAIIVLFFFLQLFYNQQIPINIKKIILLPVLQAFLIYKQRLAYAYQPHGIALKEITVPHDFIALLYDPHYLLPLALLILITTLLVYNLLYNFKPRTLTILTIKK